MEECGPVLQDGNDDIDNTPTKEARNTHAALVLAFSTLARLGVALEKSHDGRVVHCPLDELLQRQFSVQILVHLSENLVCAFLWRRLVLWHLHHCAHHLVNGLENNKA